MEITEAIENIEVKDMDWRRIEMFLSLFQRGKNEERQDMKCLAVDLLMKEIFPFAYVSMQEKEKIYQSMEDNEAPQRGRDFVFHVMYKLGKLNIRPCQNCSESPTLVYKGGCLYTDASVICPKCLRHTREYYTDSGQYATTGAERALKDWNGGWAEEAMEEEKAFLQQLLFRQSQRQ